MSKSTCTVLRYIFKIQQLIWSHVETGDDDIWHHWGIILVPSNPGRVRTFWLLTRKHPCRASMWEKDPGCIMCVPGDTQGSLPLPLAASEPQELLCHCPNHLKAAGQWPAGTQERIFPTATISYWICAWAPPPGDVAAEDSRINIFFCIKTPPYYWSSNCNITSSSRHSKTLLSKHQFAHLHRQIFTKQSKTVGFPLHRGTVKHYNKFP